MPSTNAALAFAVMSVVLVVVPGPSVMFVIGRAISAGRRAAVITVAGNGVGIFVQVLAVAAGLGTIVSRSILAFAAIKLLGAGYLAYLGLRAILDRKYHVNADTSVSEPKVFRRVFLDGFVVGVANPKSIVFFAAILPQFTNRSSGNLQLQMAVLGTIFVGIALVLDTVWALLAGTARNWFASSPKRLQRLEAAGGGVMIGLGLKLALTSHTD